GDCGHLGSSLLERRRFSPSGVSHSSDHDEFWNFVLRISRMAENRAYDIDVSGAGAFGMDLRANLGGLASCSANTELLLSRPMGVVRMAGPAVPNCFSLLVPLC